MFLDSAPLAGTGGSGSADVQAGLRQTLRAVLDMQAGWAGRQGSVCLCSVRIFAGLRTA